MLDQKKCPVVGEMARLGKSKDLSSVSRMHAKKFPALGGRDRIPRAGQLVCQLISEPVRDPVSQETNNKSQGKYLLRNDTQG